MAIELKDEQWRDVAGHEGVYQISSFGRLRSVDREYVTKSRWGPCVRRLRGKVVATHPNRNGYHSVTLSTRGERTKASIHRLVCLAFHGEPPTDQHQAAHIDGDHSNNRADNLKWATQSENEADKRAHGRYNHGSQKLTENDVRRIRRLKDSSVDAVCADYGISKANVYKIWSGSIWGHVI